LCVGIGVTDVNVPEPLEVEQPTVAWRPIANGVLRPWLLVGHAALVEADKAVFAIECPVLLGVRTPNHLEGRWGSSDEELWVADM
jgi:hypothetical protein